ncbi:MAG: hypothetical protein AAB401_08655, partial [Acidobacteriota bacterium]
NELAWLKRAQGTSLAGGGRQENSLLRVGINVREPIGLQSEQKIAGKFSLDYFCAEKPGTITNKRKQLNKQKRNFRLLSYFRSVPLSLRPFPK